MMKPKVLFLCTGNSCRTQMAEAFLRDLAEDRFEITSAGAEEAPLDPDAVQAMRELGIDMFTQHPKKVDRFLGQRFSFVISLCDREQEKSCPIFPGAIWRLQWALDSPSGVHAPEERSVAVRRLRDQIREKVFEFVSKHS
jgi:arsenate reductase (thioredoxin)